MNSALGIILADQNSLSLFISICHFHKILFNHYLKKSKSILIFMFVFQSFVDTKMDSQQENFKNIDNEGHENPAFENTEKIDITRNGDSKKIPKNLLEA